MILAHYEHRLPADYDLESIRARAKARGPLWDSAGQLYFKGFLLREAGRFGAIGNNYSSLYLWRDDEAFRVFLTSGRYRSVTDMFGRASIRTRFALDACRGHGQQARFALAEEADIPVDADLSAAFASETERNRRIAAQPGTVAAVVGVDTQRWRFTRIVLTEGEPAASEGGTRYEVLHLARPLLDTLPAGDA
ncbi:DUF4865 family protein [Paraburkholderia ginsengisoli]|uniref:DUF4865 family protein n=2 Tax=Paraburkholderia ginsengisoli TaxID=311231 RepID=A0A7T4TCA0_9BURK|nr:DUF4865 family protein [Paraburkholderia ginsengisoli]